MAVDSIKHYKQENGVEILKVFCKPTVNFPEGSNYFYADVAAYDLIKDFCWYLVKNNNTVEVTAMDCWRNAVKFHRELFFMYQGWYCDYIDHVSGISFDNVDNNLNVVSQPQTKYAAFTRGYSIQRRGSVIDFAPLIGLAGVIHRPYRQVHREDEACILQNSIEQEWLREKLGFDWYMFDFKMYRRGSEDILDLERTGQISEEEAVFRHVMRYAKDNAWYVLRYDLQDYFKQSGIALPEYRLDESGFMVHPVTGQRLCPFPYKGGQLIG